MNAGPDVERRISGYLAEQTPTRAPDRILHATFERTRHTRQRRFGAAWRFSFMNGNSWRIAVAAVIAVVIIGVGTVYLGGSQGGVGGQPAPSPSPSPSPSSPLASTSPSPEPTPVDTTGWVPYTSDRYAYDIAYPPTWTPTPATRDWAIEVDRTEVSEGTDLFVEDGTAYQIAVTAFAASIPAGTSNDEWIAGYIPPPGTTFDSCTPRPPDQWEAITVDGRPALFNPNACSASQAFVFIGDRAYVFSVWRENQVPLLKAFLSTVRFRPAAAPPTSP